MEKRRKHAARLFKAGTKQAEVARTLGVSRQSVSRWYRDWKNAGPVALKAAGRAGRKPKLGANDLRKIDKALREGARASGYHTDLWTLKRVSEVIETTTGIRYHPGHVWRILKENMGWSLQRPAKKAKERNEEAVKIWIAEKWPELKKNE